MIPSTIADREAQARGQTDRIVKWAPIRAPGITPIAQRDRERPVDVAEHGVRDRSRDREHADARERRGDRLLERQPTQAANAGTIRTPPPMPSRPLRPPAATPISAESPDLGPAVERRRPVRILFVRSTRSLAARRGRRRVLDVDRVLRVRAPRSAPCHALGREREQRRGGDHQQMAVAGDGAGEQRAADGGGETERAASRARPAR